MTIEAFYTVEELRRLVAVGGVSTNALESISGIEQDRLTAFLGETQGATGPTSQPHVLSTDERARLSILAVQLTEGLQIGDDERLTAIFESLTNECHLTLGNIARLTGCRIDDLESVLRDPWTLSFATRYELAIRGSYLIMAVNRARGR